VPAAADGASTVSAFGMPNCSPGHRNICIRGRPPSTAGVEKFALLVPEPSCASQRTSSPPAPPRP
jgi:hypothetical protein